jgi:AbrB family looped-hinge helix DNA binding protein
MCIATISSKYQVVIPRQVREQFGVKPGHKMVFIRYKNSLRMVIIPPIEEAYGFLPGIDTRVEHDEENSGCAFQRT